MIILVNVRANGGKALEKWRRLQLPHEARLTSSAEEARREVFETTHDVVVAAGGDGTVNCVLNAILDTGRPIKLGAIGLGSSNDFHKPYSDDVPMRIDASKARPVDVGRATLTDADGRSRVRHFLLNASLGFVAEGNAFFNSGTPSWLKRGNVEAAILYAAFVNLVRFRPITASVRLDDAEPVTMPLASLGVLKKVHFAGGMKYDTPVVEDDGMFDVNVWGRMGRAGIVRTMASLYRGRFRGLPRTQSWRARRVVVEPEAPAHFELDGEISRIVRADLEVLPKAIEVCG